MGLAQRADTLIYSILFSDRDAYDGAFASAEGKKALQRISHETGGAFFEVSTANPISAIYTQLAEQLRNQYSIGYTPDQSTARPEYRKIHLATKRPDCRLRPGKVTTPATSRRPRAGRRCGGSFLV